VYCVYCEMKQLLPVLLLLCSFLARSQDGQTIIRVLDITTQRPIAQALVNNDEGKLLVKTDTAGYAVLALHELANVKYLIVIAGGYSIDTAVSSTTTIYLEPLLVSLPEATISAGQVKRLFNSETEYIVDYSFDNDKIVALTYSGSNGKKAKAILMDNDGREIARVSLAKAPISLFRSCAGVNYCVAQDGFYRIDISDKSLDLPVKYENTILPALQRCECAAYGNLYYRVSNPANFSTVYGVVEKGDSVFRPFKSFSEPLVARASYMELMEIIDLYEHYQFSEAARKAQLRRMWDNGTLSHISLPLFLCGDILVIFDYNNRQIVHFDLQGNELRSIPIKFAWKHSQQFEIIQDEVSGNLFIHRFDNKQKHTLEQLDINTGETTASYVIKKPFTEKLKVHANRIYYLWQDLDAHRTQQLYMQEMR